MRTHEDELPEPPAKSAKRHRRGLTSSERHRLIAEASYYAYPRGEDDAPEGYDPLLEALDAEDAIEARRLRAR
jgi:hypothetical protein